MRTTKLTDDVIQLTRFGAVNAYLVREDDGFTLVDTMFSGSAKGLIAAAEAAGAPIRRIVLTHGHSDHAASVDGLREILGADVPYLVPARDAKIMAGDKTLEPGEGDRKLKGGWPKVKTAPDVLLAPGDRVESLEVIASPGHTPGHVAFLDTRDRALICGDAFQTLGGTTVAGQTNWRFPLVKLATWDPARALASARELRALEPTLLAPGHGRGLSAPLDGIDASIAGAKEGLMARAGLSAERVVDLAAELADRDGLEAVTLTAVAEAAGVRPPSLYAHVGGLEDLRRRLGARGAAELAAAMRDAAVGRSGERALREIAAAYRAYAHRRPGLYLAAQQPPRPGDAEGEAAAAEAVAVLAAVLAGWGLEGSDAIHAIRGVRATLHGFVGLEAAGGFGLPEDVDESFDRLIATLGRGVAAASTAGAAT